MTGRTGHDCRVEAQDGGDPDRTVATRTTGDLRRARQRARESVRSISDDVEQYLDRRDLSGVIDNPSQEQRLNDQLTRLAQQRLFSGLLDWLRERRKVVMGRAARAAFDRMQTALTAAGVARDLTGSDSMSREDRSINQMVNDVDAGLLEDLSDEAGDRMTRHIRQGFRERDQIGRQQDGTSIGRRVDMVLTDGDDPDRQKVGVEGQTIMSKGEMIAHDSIQDAYTHAARRRYLRNGFRYATFDAVIDFKTSDVCTRMNEVLIDMVKDPHLVPPLHPWCRSDLRPTLNQDGNQPVRDDDIADDFLQKIYQTKSYRPPEPSDQYFRPTPLTNQVE